MKQIYLGDGLYAEYDGFQVKLMANSPTRPTDTVYMDSHTLGAFLAWVESLKEPHDS